MGRRTYLLAALAAMVIAIGGGCARARFAIRTLFADAPTFTPFSHEPHLARGTSCLHCHTAPDEKPRDRGLIFSHVQHEKPTSGNCMRCHEDQKIPPMDSCADGCHAEDFQDLRCDRCHEDLTRYPLQSVKSWAHTREFERRHGPAARSDSATCTTCHEATYCSDCHSDGTAVALDQRRIDRATRGFIHPAPYETLHALDAQAGKDNCDSCHRPTFCTSCHATRGLAGVENLSKTQHPNGWLDPMSSSFHGIEARRSINSCASCHDRGEQSVCVSCHQVGGTGGNPHPRELLLRNEDPRQNRMCRTCHI
jgi:hypothetical protein